MEGENQDSSEIIEENDVYSKTIHGTNAQNLIEKITRAKIFEAAYWKEHCFALNAETMIDKAVELKSYGGLYSGFLKPTNFLCLLLKMLHIAPEKEIVFELIKDPTYRIVRILAAFYLRLVGTAKEIYTYLEPLYIDFRRIRKRTVFGFEISHVDEAIEELLTKDYFCDIKLPHLQKRIVLEENGTLEPRISVLMMEQMMQDNGEEVNDVQGGSQSEDSSSDSEERRRRKKEKKERKKRKEEERQKRKRSPSKEDKDDEMDEIRRTNEIRANLGMKPLYGPVPQDKSKRDRSRSKERKRSKDRSRERRRSKDRSRERDRDRKRSKDRSRERRRSKDRSRERRRSKDRSRERKRSKDRSRERRRSKDRSRERDRDRKRSKDRSRERRRSKDRSRERKRSRDRDSDSKSSRDKRKKNDPENNQNDEEMDIQRTNEMRAKLGLKPLYTKK